MITWRLLIKQEIMWHHRLQQDMVQTSHCLWEQIQLQRIQIHGWTAIGLEMIYGLKMGIQGSIIEFGVWKHLIRKQVYVLQM